MSTPVWRDPSAEVPRSPLPEGRVDVAVVGAGVTGLITALLLARGGRRVAVVEARRVGAGASGATTAKATLLQRTRLADLAAHHSPAVAGRYLAAHRHGFDWLTQFCRAHQVPVDRTRAVTFSTGEEGADAVRREFLTARELGLPVTLDEHPPEEFATHAAVSLPDMLQLDPADLLVALSRAFTEAGGTISDGTRVTDLSALPAAQIVLATASPILDRQHTTMSLAAERSYLCAYDVSGPLPEGMFISAEDPTVSVRTAVVDGAAKLLVGGQGHPTGRMTDTGRNFAALDAWAARHVPGARRTHAWSAQDYHPVGMLPHVEKLGWGDGRVFFAGGYSKWGMTAAPTAAHMLVDLLDDREPELSFGDPRRNGTRSTAATAGSLARAAGAAAVNLGRAFTGGSTRGPDDSTTLAEGEAAAAHAGARPVGEAVVDGRHCRVSLLCTHMGGPLAWNEAEGSWDCPLHGSRFAADGSVLEGPAVAGLTRIDREQ